MKHKKYARVNSNYRDHFCKFVKEKHTKIHKET